MFLLDEMKKKLKTQIPSQFDGANVLTYSIQTIQSGNHYDFENDSVDATVNAIRIYLELSYEVGSFIRVEVWLPENWNEDTIALGNGGIAGQLVHHLLNTFATKGYASSHTDVGTGKGKRSGISNVALWKDYGFRATHLMAVCGKELAEIAYSSKIQKSFYRGASTGGQQAVSALVKYPYDYDGVVCGVPAKNRVPLHAYFIWNYQKLRDENGTKLFSLDDMDNIAKLGKQYLDDKGYSKKPFPHIPNGNIQDIEEFLVILKNKLHFEEKQISALRDIYVGPIQSSTGKRIYCGLPIGSEVGTFGLKHILSKQEMDLDYVFLWALGDRFSLLHFDFNSEFDEAMELEHKYLSFNSPDLKPFFSHGGKLMMATATGDPCVPFPDILRYIKSIYETVGDDMLDKTRFYLSPGMDHQIASQIVNEKGEQLIDLMRDWVHFGKVEDQLFVQDESVRFEIIPYDFTKDTMCPPTCDESFL